MPAINRVKRDHLLQLRLESRRSPKIIHKKAVTKKIKKLAANRKTIVTERKRQLEDSFANINAELIKQSRLPHNALPFGYNIFMDILKIRQVIELDDEEQTQQFERIEDESAKDSGRMAPHQNEVEEEILIVEEKNSAADGTFLTKSTSKRSVQQKQKSLSAFENDIDSSNTVTELTDMDLRLLVDQQQCLPSSSSYSMPVQSTDNSPSPFITRARFDARTPALDLGKRYKLNGLRYFQDIPGRDLWNGVSNKSPQYEKKSLKIVSFNVLCQRSMDKMPHLYSHLRHSANTGRWEQRKENLLIEFDRLDADVLCLQEVQDTHFTQHFLPFFTKKGYLALFTPRKGVDMPDGCATFWRHDQLELIKSNSVYYNLGVHGMHKDNVGQVLAFSVVGTRSVICISNTHIYFNMKYGQIKLAQMAYLLCSMHQMESQIFADSSNFFHFVGHILCGDFNMHPATPLHKFMVARSVDLRQNPAELAWTHPPVAKRHSFPFFVQLPVYCMQISSNCTFVNKESASELLDLKKVVELTHSFTFASVYEHWNALGEPEVSIYHKFEAEAPDFIFYSVAEQRDIFENEVTQQQRRTKDEHTTDKPLAYESFIRLSKRLSMPTRAQLDCACGPLPNVEHGSDHLSLMAIFELLVLPR